MIRYIKTLSAGIISGAVTTQLLNMGVQAWIHKPITIGGEVLIPVLIVLIGYIGWITATEYFNEVKYKEIYQKGYDDGQHKIVIHVEDNVESNIEMEGKLNDHK